MGKLSTKAAPYMRFITLGVAAIFVGLDQLFKYLAVEYLSPVSTVPLWKDVFHLTYLENEGAAFGILAGRQFILTGLTSVIMLALIVIILSKKIKSTWLLWSLSLILSGGVGNLIDRIARGYVVDYLHFKAINFAIFNFADCCVVIGTILFIIYFIFIDDTFINSKKESVQEQAKEENE